MGDAENDPEAQARIRALRQGLQALGWTEGGNLRTDYRWDITDLDHALISAAALVGLTPDAILATGTPNVTALQKRTRTIPIVFVLVADPVGDGFVESLAHPGGNITGFLNFEDTMGVKWLEGLKEIAPDLRCVTVIMNPESVCHVRFWHSIDHGAVIPSRIGRGRGA